MKSYYLKGKRIDIMRKRRMNMIELKVKELLEKSGISRYRLQKMTNWNYKRINDFYFGRVKQVTLEEIEQLCAIFQCDVKDIMCRK